MKSITQLAEEAARQSVASIIPCLKRALRHFRSIESDWESIESNFKILVTAPILSALKELEAQLVRRQWHLTYDENEMLWEVWEGESRLCEFESRVKAQRLKDAHNSSLSHDSAAAPEVGRKRKPFAWSM